MPRVLIAHDAAAYCFLTSAVLTFPEAIRSCTTDKLGTSLGDLGDSRKLQEFYIQHQRKVLHPVHPMHPNYSG